MLAQRSGGDARVALSALERAVENARSGGGAATVDVAAAEDALQRRAVEYDRAGRPPLRLHLGLDQGHPRLRRRRLALLPGGDARGRRGPALHRPPHGHPRLRGHRQRRPPGAARRRRRRARGRPRRPARVRAQPRPGLRLPRPGAEVERLLPGARAPPGPRSARTAPGRRPTTCATPTTRARRARARRADTATRTTSPTGSATSSCSPRASRTPLLRPHRARLRGRAGPPARAPEKIASKRVNGSATSCRPVGVLGAAFQARARESRHTGRRPGLGASGRDLRRGIRGDSTTARHAVVELRETPPTIVGR